MIPPDVTAPDTIVYVSTDGHPFISDSHCPAIAISCYRHGKANEGQIGFACSESSRAVRRKMVNNRYHFDGESLHFVEKNQETRFVAHQISGGGFTIKAVSQRRGQLAKPQEHFNLDEEFATELKESFSSRPVAIVGGLSLHRDWKFASELGALHVAHGLELQYWPFLTEYESVCYLFGRDRAELYQQVEEFFESNNLNYEKVEPKYFPVY